MVDTNAIRDAYNHPAILDLADEIDKANVLLEQAYELLDNARCSLADPGITRTWGQRRRRFRDAVIERRV